MGYSFKDDGGTLLGSCFEILRYSGEMIVWKLNLDCFVYLHDHEHCLFVDLGILFKCVSGNSQ